MPTRYNNASCDATVFCPSSEPHWPPLLVPSSNTVCWPRQVSAQDEICHRGRQLSQGDIEKLDIQARVVADSGAPGDNGMLHAVGDIADVRICPLHQVIQLFSIGLEILLSVAVPGLLRQPVPQLLHPRRQRFLTQDGCPVVPWLNYADLYPKEVKLSPVR